ncbi:hypothetical protein ABPG72_021340 [Tetrahymena utriculariae]
MFNQKIKIKIDKKLENIFQKLRVINDLKTFQKVKNVAFEKRCFCKKKKKKDNLDEEQKYKEYQSLIEQQIQPVKKFYSSQASNQISKQSELIKNRQKGGKNF